MSKKKKEKVEEPKKAREGDGKEKPTKAAKGKKNIVPASLPVLVQAAAPSPAPEAPAPKAKKAAAKRKPAGKKPAKAGNSVPVEEIVVVEEIVISNDDIALRAYFIAEKRRTHGHWGDETGDWVEAERQLREEATRKKK